MIVINRFLDSRTTYELERNDIAMLLVLARGMDPAMAFHFADEFIKASSSAA